MKNKLRVVAVLVLLALLCPAIAVAQPPMPLAFTGSVTIGGASAPDGTAISAEIDGVEVETTTTTGGTYYIEIDQDGNIGKTVVFKVNGVVGGQAEYVDPWDTPVVDLDLETYTLTVSADPVGGGAVDLNPADGDAVTPGAQYPSVEPVTVTLDAQPASGFVFDHWSGDLTDSADPKTLLMDDNKTVTAHFEGELGCQRFFDDVEGDVSDWSATGFWHQITDAENIFVLNQDGATPDDPPNDINPDLVTLPDTDASGHAYLPEAYSGDSAFWYGVDDNGTFIDDPFNLGIQTAKNGGRSTAPNSGDLTSPVIDLTGLTAVTLSFRTWWEIEGVDANVYDMMYVQVSADGGGFTTIGALNPVMDVNNLSYQNYSTGGSNAVPIWVESLFDLSDYAGHDIQLRFRFDTRDNLYNGFRGWFIDDVSVTCGGLSAPEVTDVEPWCIEDPCTVLVITGSNFANGATVEFDSVPAAQSAVISTSEIHALFPDCGAGSGSSAEGRDGGSPPGGSSSALGYGTYDVTVTNPDEQSDTLHNAITYAEICVPAPQCAFTASPLTGLAPLRVQFTDSSTGDIDTWAWDFDNDGVIDSTQQNPSYTYTAAGRYTVTLTATGPGGSCTETKVAYIIVQELPMEEEGPPNLVPAYLLISPEQVLPNQEVEISINIGNDGGTSGTRSIALYINGNLEDSQTVSVSPGSAKNVVFRVTKTEAGTYQVLLEGNEGQFTVLGTADARHWAGPLGTGGIIAIVVFVIALVLGLVFVLRRE